MFDPYRIAFAPAGKYGYGFFSHIRTVISARSYAVRRGSGSKVESHISDRCSYYTGELLMSAWQSIQYNVKIA